MSKFEQVHQEFVNDLKAKDRAEATILAYGKDIEQFLDYVEKQGKTNVKQIKKDHITGFMEDLEKQKYTKKSISRKLNSIKTFSRLLKAKQYITEDPATLVSHPKFETPPPRILTQTEYRALRDAARDDVRTFAIIELLLQTGIRIGELANIKLSELKLKLKEKTGNLTIPSSRVTLGRTIPLNPSVVSAISAYLKEKPESKTENLFVTRTGNPLLVRNIRAAIDRYYKKAGVKDATINDLRHTWIAHHLKKGANLLTISKLAGHKRLATTEKYLQFVTRPEKEKEALEEL